MRVYPAPQMRDFNGVVRFERRERSERVRVGEGWFRDYESTGGGRSGSH